jgi:hypothetical protein
VRNVTDKSQPVAGANDFGAIGSEPMMDDDAGLEIADVVGV